jgi:YVTN family beta-propeller protein
LKSSDASDKVPRVKFVFTLIATLVLAAGPAAATLLISNTKSESASVIDTDTLEVVATIPLGKTAWVVYDKSHDLGVIDVGGRKLPIS